MSTPSWMMEAPSCEPRRGGAVRYGRRSTDRRLALDTILAAGDYILESDTAAEPDASNSPPGELIQLFR
jgi:hypothetical protein